MRRVKGRVSQAELVRDVFRRYIEAKREFLTAAEACSIKGWPDRKPAILNAWKLQFLYNERESLRFEHWIETDDSDGDSWISVSSISRRLMQDWADAKEKALADRDPDYKKIVAEIAACQATLDEDAIYEPFEAARHDPEYATALLAMQQKLRELDSMLARE